MSIYKELFILEAQRIVDELTASGVDTLSAIEIAYAAAMTTTMDERSVRVQRELQLMPSHHTFLQ